jgi:hypothetical protein
MQPERKTGFGLLMGCKRKQPERTGAKERIFPSPPFFPFSLLPITRIVQQSSFALKEHVGADHTLRILNEAPAIANIASEGL